MSYVRFGEDGSDVYVYDDVSGGLCCCGCALLDGGGFPSNFFGADLPAVLTHLAEHRAAGHDVPEFVEERLRADHSTVAEQRTADDARTAARLHRLDQLM